MHYVGIDLAWGQRAPTGVAVLDPEARLLHVSSQRTDDEVAAAVEGVVAGGPCLVAIDAPLIVRNATGNRGCEAALNKDFARFDAGAHPANTGKPEFAETPRGARIAGQLRLDLNPRSGRQRRAIEVYPHPATVALFRLGPQPEVQEQGRPRPREPAQRAARADGLPGDRRGHRRRAVGPSA